MEELSRAQGDVPFGWLEALRRLFRRRAVAKAVPPPRRPGEVRPPLLPDDLHHLAAPR